MSLMTYQDVRPWARSIKQRVTERQMPPWGIDPHVGIQSFKNDPSLRDDEIADDREVGRRRRADGQRRRHAEAARVRRRRSLAYRKAGRDRHLAEARRAGRGGRLVGQLLRRHRPYRGSLHQGDREQAGQDRRRAPSAHVRRRRRHDRRQQRRRQQPRSVGRVPERVRGRQERRPVSGRHRTSAARRLEDQVRLPLPLGRPGDHRSVAARHRALPERLHAEARRLLEAAGTADRAARHSRRIDLRPQRRLHALQQGRARSPRSSRTCTRAASGSASS